MQINVQAELAAAQVHLERAIKGMLQQREIKHVPGLGRAKHTVQETLTQIQREEAGHVSHFKIV
ncbi:MULTISPECIES: hypothetical protein [unclassified Paenibacillus]|uniref:hypothetical protein n=1 Tax=unclassified Paenibacillus TaxID=185978 RepID=UPI0024071AAC|nr:MULTISPECIES: hypothetical protein [unclassified Paenibacillus]MDF9844585.1 hypothetical protein [Paenibacillus sp. PastF-2]MDF9851237.1 hypothetical protein [Paenibacillus sp. PastM-2]MDF9857770.1 hypothetical protein [Paenibacillus sp. PastF-1]MDH6483086.1 hypothetical protein [Paenibacillus sp. PastH-2]MDH6510450.1 hypothetical protein [Paenibacillus sp. PastM-3]